MNSSKITIELSNYTDMRNNLTIEDFIKLLSEHYDNSFYRMTNVLIIIPYLLIVIISFIGNAFVVRVCFKHQTTTNLLIGSLATSDLLMTVFNIPFNVARLLLDHWPFGQVLCFLVPFVQAMVVYVSSWTMAVIAFNRLKSILSIGRVINSKRTLILTILLTWLVSGIMALPHSIFNQVVSLVTFKQVTRCRVMYPESDYDIPLIISCEAFLTQYFIPLSIACCTYIKIGKIIVKQGRLASTKGMSNCLLVFLIKDFDQTNI